MPSSASTWLPDETELKVICSLLGKTYYCHLLTYLNFQNCSREDLQMLERKLSLTYSL